MQPFDPSDIASSQPPWHMWGTSKRVTVVSNGSISTSQLTKINYKRPDTWTFWIGARLLSGPVDGVITQVVTVRVNIIVGVGRSSFSTKPPSAFSAGFARFQIQVPPLVAPSDVPPKYTTSVLSPLMDDSDATSAREIAHFPASDINVEANASYLSNVGDVIDLEVSAYFAPRTHVRPDWFSPQPAARFRGGEVGGT